MKVEGLPLRTDQYLLSNTPLLEAVSVFKKSCTLELPVLNEAKQCIGLIGLATLAAAVPSSSSDSSLGRAINYYKPRFFDVRDDVSLQKISAVKESIIVIVESDSAFKGFITKDELLFFILRGTDGRPSFFHLQEELKKCRELEEEYHAIFDNSHDGIYITDGGGYTLRLNKACERIEGVRAEDLVGKHMSELVNEGYYSESVSLKVIETGKPVTILQKTKKSSEILATGTPVFRDGKIIRVIVNSRDISELNRMRRELDELKALSQKYETELELLRKKQEESMDFIYRSASMHNLVEMVRHVAAVDTTILIQGESGSGKGLLARMIHLKSERRNGPFIKIDCGIIPYTLIESELFGYEKGAFTGADTTGKIGLIELASGGTLFLDEVGELPVDMQVKILQVIQDREIRRVGGKHAIPVDIKIVTATNKNLSDMVKNRLFRKDLFYRLNVVPLFVPPLRERKEDIPPLVFSRIENFNKKYGMSKWITREALEILGKYDWPGNVRELENVVERVMVTTRNDEIRVSDIPEEIIHAVPFCGSSKEQNSCQFKQRVQFFEKELLLKIKSESKSTKEMAAKLGLDRSTVTRKCGKYGIPLIFHD